MTPVFGPLQAEPQTDQYHELYQQFRWHVPTYFNIADGCCHRWASDKTRVAIFYEDENGHTSILTYAAMQTQANRMTNVLRGLGVRRGERIAIILPQRPETAVALMACFQLGAVAVPMSILCRPGMLEARLRDSGAVVAIADQSAMESLNQIRPRCPDLEQVIAVDCEGRVTLDWYAEIARASGSFQPIKTLPAEPALLIYTSGASGAGKGALLPHAALIGNLSGFVASQNWFPKDGDVFWSPADWTGTGGLMNALLPTLYFGKPILGYRGRFSAGTAFQLLEKYAITNTFLYPAMLNLLMKAVPAPAEQYALKLRAIMSAGEALGDALFHWSQSALGVTINEMFGQTEMNYIVGNSVQRWPAKAGSMGRAYPGHQLGLVDDAGKPVPTGAVGEIALRRHDIHGVADPIFFLEYWKNPQATHDKFSGDWCRTGDLATMDEDGYLWYRGRAEDWFDAGDYRIDPCGIEHCLLRHRAVAYAAVAPKPDAQNGNLIKAFIVLNPNIKRSRAADDKLIVELQAHARAQLAHFEYPQEIEFIDELPMTITGKLRRRVLRQLEEERANEHAAARAE